MTRDELKALWAELGENHYNHRIGDYATDIPPGPPRPGFDECDRFVPRVPRDARDPHPRPEAGRCSATSAPSRPRGTNNEVWNHGIGKYTAKLPRRSPARASAPSSSTSSSTPTPARRSTARTTKPRVINYVYTLVYGLDGKVDETQAATLRLDRPSAARRCSPAEPPGGGRDAVAGINPYVTEANVRALDLANGGGRPAPRDAPAVPPGQPGSRNSVAPQPSDPAHGGPAIAPPAATRRPASFLRGTLSRFRSRGRAGNLAEACPRTGPRAAIPRD